MTLILFASFTSEWLVSNPSDSYSHYPPLSRDRRLLAWLYVWDVKSHTLKLYSHVGYNDEWLFCYMQNYHVSYSSNPTT